jgi:hypothetical protein
LPSTTIVEQLGVGEGGALRGQVVAAVGGVGIEVLFRQAHLRQVFAGGAGGQDRVGRRQVVGGDVVGSTASGRMPRSVRSPASAPSQYGGRRM